MVSDFVDISFCLILTSGHELLINCIVSSVSTLTVVPDVDKVMNPGPNSGSKRYARNKVTGNGEMLHKIESYDSTDSMDYMKLAPKATFVPTV